MNTRGMYWQWQFNPRTIIPLSQCLQLALFPVIYKQNKIRKGLKTWHYTHAGNIKYYNLQPGKGGIGDKSCAKGEVWGRAA